MSTENWKLEKDLCRCCHSEGSFKNLAEPYIISGSAEIYSDMLKDCFNIDIAPVPGMLCAMTYTICETCISRLRDATDFKKQVQASEEKFRDIYNRNIITAVVPTLNISIKVELPETYDEDDFKEESPKDDDFDDGDVGEDVGDDYKESLDVRNDEDESGNTEEGRRKKKKLKSKKSEKIKSCKKGRPRKLKQETADTDEKKTGSRNTYYTVIQNQYECKVCAKVYASQPLVSQHYRFVHLKRRPKDRKCPKCDERIPGYLRAHHLDKKHGIPAPTCGVCGKKFRFPGNVLQHQKKVHMGEKTAVCDVCQKSFFDKLSLRLHMSTHSDEKRFKCTTCDRQFRWENNLKDHIKIHTGDKRFVCRVCEKAFVQKTTLKQHTARNHPETTKYTDTYYTIEKLHDGTKKYNCKCCTSTFKTQPSAVQHYRHVHLHLRPKLRSCYYCEMRVPAHTRAFHLEKEHGIPAPTCGACGKKFSYPFQVLRHQKNIHMGEKTFSCNDCDMKFTSHANLTQHVIKHSPIRLHKCDMCDKTFKWKKNLKTHMMMHLDDRRHVCHVCQQAFVQQTSLKYHITKHHPEFIK